MRKKVCAKRPLIFSENSVKPWGRKSGSSSRGCVVGLATGWSSVMTARGDTRARAVEGEIALQSEMDVDVKEYEKRGAVPETKAEVVGDILMMEKDGFLREAKLLQLR